jgi:AP-1 complex subunit gamma-1
MKLVASPNFPEKRIGYLGMMLLLSEQADVLMLATNSLKNDLNNSDNRFIVGLALCAIGNMATADMSRDLVPEVDKHLTNAKPYLRKKACLAMARCLTKCPEMIDDFVDRVVGLLNDRTHGVLITVLQLMTRVLVMDMEYNNHDGEGGGGGGDGGTTTDATTAIVVATTTTTPCRKAFLQLVPALVKLLRNLLSMGYSPEHDVGGISDPFLQVQILTLLRLLGMNNVKASEDMNDVLAQVATNTETSKNAGNAILYECVQTIMAIESDDGLRVLAVNILGRFLLNRDNNIRYVALNTLARCIITDGGKSSGSGDDGAIIVDGNGENGNGKGGANTAASALQRHRTTVVDCLRDPDISIRQRALELIYHLVNRDNVEALTAELLNYLVLCPREHRSDICTRILRVVDKYSPDDRWRVDTLVTMLTIAGRECNSNVQSSTSVYISRSTEDLRAYSTHRLLKAVRDDDGSQRGLLNVGIWCIGEYGDLLLRGYSYNPPTTTSKAGVGGGGVVEDGLLSLTTTTVTFEALEPCAIVDIVKAVMDRTTIQEETKERILTCFAKLRERFADTADAVTLTRLQTLVEKYEGSHSLELQLRSIEYGRLLNAIKGVSVKRAPVNKMDQEEDLFGVGGDGAGSSSEIVSETVKTAAKEALARMPVVDVKLMQRKREERAGALRMSIMDDPFGSENGSAIATGTASSSGGGDLLDLEDIFGGGGGASSTVVPTVAKSNGIKKAVAAANHASTPSDADLLSDIFSMPPVTAAAPPAPPVVGGFDMFSSPSVGASMMPPVPAFGTNFDMFGATPQPPVSSPFSPAPSMSSVTSGGFDVFGATATPGSVMTLPAPTSLQTSMTSSMSGTVPLQSSNTSSTMMSSGGSSVGSSSVSISSTPNESVGVTVPGFTHEGLTVEFVCTKPDAWNKQNSVLLAKFINTTDAPLYGLHLQVAVPKYVTMEMKPPTSTTVPVSAAGGQQQQTKGLVTQTISVTNTMLGTKNLMLKVKASFTSKGTKVEHTTTCSGFPAGQY